MIVRPSFTATTFLTSLLLLLNEVYSTSSDSLLKQCQTDLSKERYRSALDSCRLALSEGI